MKTAMKKVAAKAVKGHEKKMHGKKYQAGGRVMPEVSTMGGRGMGRGAEMGNAGGAMRGLERAAAMSGRDFSGMGRPATAGRPAGFKSGGMTRGNPATPGGQGQAQAGKVFAKGGGIEKKGKTRGKVC
jgi:hypothetical protein